MQSLPASMFKEEKVDMIQQPSKADAEKVDYMDKRFSDMQASRTTVDRKRTIYQEMIDADYKQYPDERSSSVVPLASAMIELFVADALRLETQYNFKAGDSKQQTATRTLEHLRKKDFTEKNRKKQFVKDEYTAAGFGTSLMLLGFDKCERKQKELTLDENDEPTWQEKAYTDQGIIVSSMDIRQAWIDNEAIEGIDDANDFFYREWVSYEKFMELKGNRMYKNIDQVRPKEYSNEYKTFTVDEENTKQGNYVEKKYYWNVVKDCYMVVANGILVREHPITTTIDGKKAIPVMVRGLGYKNYSIYYRGLCEGLLMFNSEINNLREMLMDAIRRSNTQVLALGGGLTFNGRGFAYDNEIITFDGSNFDQNFKQISGNPPNQAIFNYLTQIYKDIAIYVGIDVQNIMGEPQQTAFQTEVQRASSQKRINVWLTNRDLAYERFANLYKEILQVYGPVLYPELEIEGEKLIGEGENARYKKSKGKSTIKITQELLQGKVNMDVYTNTTAPTIQAVDREQKLDFLTRVGTIAQNYALAKQSGYDLESIFPFKKAVQDIAEDSNIEINEGSDQEDVQAEKNKIIEQMKAMMPPIEGQPAPQPQGQPEQIPRQPTLTPQM